MRGGVEKRRGSALALTIPLHSRLRHLQNRCPPHSTTPALLNKATRHHLRTCLFEERFSLLCPASSKEVIPPPIWRVEEEVWGCSFDGFLLFVHLWITMLR